MILTTAIQLATTHQRFRIDLATARLNLDNCARVDTYHWQRPDNRLWYPLVFFYFRPFSVRFTLGYRADGSLTILAYDVSSGSKNFRSAEGGEVGNGFTEAENKEILERIKQSEAEGGGVISGGSEVGIDK